MSSGLAIAMLSVSQNAQSRPSSRISRSQNGQHQARGARNGGCEQGMKVFSGLLILDVINDVAWRGGGKILESSSWLGR